MSRGDIVGRTDALLGRYGKYDEADPERGGAKGGKDKGKGAFNSLLVQLLADCEALEQVNSLPPLPAPAPLCVLPAAGRLPCSSGCPSLLARPKSSDSWLSPLHLFTLPPPRRPPSAFSANKLPLAAPPP